MDGLYDLNLFFHNPTALDFKKRMLVDQNEDFFYG